MPLLRDKNKIEIYEGKRDAEADIVFILFSFNLKKNQNLWFSLKGKTIRFYLM